MQEYKNKWTCMYIKHILQNSAVYVQNLFLRLHGTYINLACGTHLFISIVVYMGCSVQNAMVNATGLFTFLLVPHIFQVSLQIVI